MGCSYKERRIVEEILYNRSMTLMTALLATVGLAAGFLLGLAYAGRLGNNPSRVQELEERLGEVQAEQERYRAGVSEHFSTTAELVQRMTDNYREVYRHLAEGARELCSPDVAGKLPPPESGTVLDSVPDSSGEGGWGQSAGQDSGISQQPRDYAARQAPDQKGALSEEFGIVDKPSTSPPAADAE